VANEVAFAEERARLYLASVPNHHIWLFDNERTLSDRPRWDLRLAGDTGDTRRQSGIAREARIDVASLVAPGQCRTSGSGEKVKRGANETREEHPLSAEMPVQRLLHLFIRDDRLDSNDPHGLGNTSAKRKHDDSIWLARVIDEGCRGTDGHTNVG
jgi:hypothetical protein